MKLLEELKEIHQKDLTQIKEIYSETFNKDLIELREFYEGKMTAMTDDLSKLRSEGMAANYRLSESQSAADRVNHDYDSIMSDNSELADRLDRHSGESKRLS